MMYYEILSKGRLIRSASLLCFAVAVALAPASFAFADLTELARYGNTNDNGGAGVAVSNSEPALGNYSILANGTDIWGNSDHGAFLYDPVPVSGDFTAVVRSVSVGAGETLAGEWGRSGIMARADGTDAASANVAHIRKSGNTGTILQARDANGGGTNRPGGEFANAANNLPVDTTPIWLSLSRDGGDFKASWAPDDNGAPGAWSQARSRPVSGDLSGDLVLGLAHQSHNIHPTSNTAVFESYSVGALDTGVFGPDPPFLFPPADAPKGGPGFMGIREVINNGGVGNQDQARASLANGGGDIYDYTAPVLNIQDSGGSGNFGGDSNFGVVDAGIGPAKGSVDNISMAVQGTIQIDEAGDYTFGVNSDDGFTLLFPGKSFSSGDRINFDEGSALNFFGGRGASDTLGTINLPAGNHPFVMNYHEGGGGSAVELFAAKGAKSSFDGDFRLVGHQAGPDVLVAGVVGEIFASVVKRNDGGELTTLAGAIDLLNDPGTNDVFVGTVPHLSVGDPETNPHDFSFPGLDNGIDDNDFASKFSGFIEVPADGDYTFLFQTDDNSQLTIGGADFTINSTANAGATSVSADGQTVSADFLTGNTNTNVTTFLTEGFHPFEFIQLERGGGADAELFVVAGGSASPLGLLDAGAVSDVNGLQLVPEPSSIALAVFGLVGLLGYAWRRRKA